MALITMNYNSPTIGMHQNLTIILPEDVTFFDSSRTAKQLKCRTFNGRLWND